MKKDTRDINFDLLRIISSIAVILIHVNAYYLQQHFTAPERSSEWIFENIVNFVTRFSVPCFVMLSGAYSLRCLQRINAGQFYRKSFYKIVIPFITVYVFWMIVMGMKTVMQRGRWGDYLADAVKLTYGNLWYVPMLIGIYAVAPLIARLKGGKPISPVVGYLFLLWAMISQATSEYELPYSIGVIVSFLSYFIMGNILYEAKPKVKRGALIIAMLLSAVITSIWRCRNHQFYSIDPYRAFFSPCVVLLSLSVFLFFANVKIRDGGMIECVAEKTYYIYLIHTPVWIVVMKALDRIDCNEIIKIIVGSIVVFLASYGGAKLWIMLRKALDQKFGIQRRIIGRSN